MQLTSAGGAPIEVSDAVFGRAYNEALVHQVVVAYLARARHGTRRQKTRSEVRGGGSKPWRQKGTGRARAGTIRSPIWRGGGKVFAARPRSFEQKVNKKMYRAAMQVIFSELARQERLRVVEALRLDQPKTKAAVEMLAAVGVDERIRPDGAPLRILLLAWEVDMNLALGIRNLIGVEIQPVRELTPVDLVGSDLVIADQAAITEVDRFFLGGTA